MSLLTLPGVLPLIVQQAGGGGGGGGPISDTPTILTGYSGAVKTFTPPTFVGSGTITHQLVQDFGTYGRHVAGVIADGESFVLTLSADDEALPWRIATFDNDTEVRQLALDITVNEWNGIILTGEDEATENVSQRYLNDVVRTTFDGSISASLTHPPGAVTCYVGPSPFYLENPSVSTATATTPIEVVDWGDVEVHATWVDGSGDIIARSVDMTLHWPDFPQESSLSAAKEPTTISWLPGNKLLLTFVATGRRYDDSPQVRATDLEWAGDAVPAFGAQQIPNMTWRVNAVNTTIEYITMPYGGTKSAFGVTGRGGHRSWVIVDIPGSQVGEATWTVDASGGGKSVVATDLVAADKRKGISNVIKANSVGFRPKDKKLAFLSQATDIRLNNEDSIDFTGQSWWLVPAGAADETGALATGTVSERLVNGVNGETGSEQGQPNRTRHRVFEIDFSSVETEGEYELRTESGMFPITIDDGDTSRRVARKNMRFLYLQARGYIKEKPYTFAEEPVTFHPARGDQPTILSGHDENRDRAVHVGGFEAFKERWVYTDLPEFWGGMKDAADYDNYMAHWRSMVLYAEAVCLDPSVAANIAKAETNMPHQGHGDLPDMFWPLIWMAECQARGQIKTQAQVNRWNDVPELASATLSDLEGALIVGLETSDHPHGAGEERVDDRWAAFMPSPATTLVSATGVLAASFICDVYGATEMAARYEKVAMDAYHYGWRNVPEPDRGEVGRVNFGYANQALMEAMMAWKYGGTGAVSANVAADVSGDDWETRLLDNPITNSLTSGENNGGGNWSSGSGFPGNFQRDYLLQGAGFWYAMASNVSNSGAQTLVRNAVLNDANRAKDEVLSETFYGWTASTAFWNYASGPSIGLFAHPLMRGHLLTDDSDYIDALTDHMGFTLGRNAWSGTTVVGVGRRSPRQPLHLESRQGLGYVREGTPLYALADGQMGYYNNDNNMNPVSTANNTWPSMFKHFDNGVSDVTRSEYTIHQGASYIALMIYMAYRSQS